MESLHNDTEAGEPAEPGPSRKRASYKDAQVWKDIEAETGFASYTDYLEFYKDIRPDFADRVEAFQTLRKAEYASSIKVYDLFVEEGSAPTLSLCHHCDTGTELLQALREVREPLGAKCVQLVTWFYFAWSFNQERIETLLLGLKLDVKFLDDLPKAIPGGTSHRAPFIRRPTPAENFRTHHISRVLGNDIIATILQNDVANAIPIVLVMGTPEYRYTNSLLLQRIVAGREYRTPPVRRLVHEDKNKVLGATMSDSIETDTQVYAEIVDKFLQGQDATPTKAFLLLAAMSPLLYAEGYLMSKAFTRLQRIYSIIAEGKVTELPTERTASDDGDLNHSRLELPRPLEDTDRDLNNARLELRRTLEKTEDLVGQIFRYLGFAAQSDCSEEPSYVSIRADLKIVIDDASRLEAEVRDFIQDAISHAAWSESRASIELSNLQINEAKRVKIFTILAFIYVPLNLATSIFGMNIHQLNQNGQSIWVFFTTAVVALLVTGGSWRCSDSVHKARAWYRERAPPDKEVKPEYGFILRITMLVWLVRNGHKFWMWESGAWLAILVNSKVCCKTYGGRRSEPACDYVASLSRGSPYPLYAMDPRDRHFGPSATWSLFPNFFSIFSKSNRSERSSSEQSA